jgi:hypothetical protein
MKSLLNLLQEEDRILNRIYNTECDIHDYKREEISYSNEEKNLQKYNDELNKIRDDIKSYFK